MMTHIVSRPPTQPKQLGGGWIFLLWFIGWLPMVALAIVNGTVREELIAPFTDPLLAHQISTATLIILFTMYISWLSGRVPLPTRRAALSMGIIWLVMTVLFEFGFGRYIVGHSWQTLLYDYNIMDGRLWPLALLFVLLSPSLFFRSGCRTRA